MPTFHVMKPMNPVDNELKLEALNPTHFQDLFEFEKRNRRYFEQWVPARPKDYWRFESFSHHCQVLVEEANQQKGHFFVGYYNNQLIGRFNLANRSQSRAELGYRLDEAHTGKGFAFAFSELLLLEAVHLNIDTLTAQALRENPASFRILSKLGFEKTDESEITVELNGQPCHLLTFRKALNKG